MGLAALVMAMSLFWGFVTLALVAGAGAAVLHMIVVWVAIRWFNTETGATRLTIVGSVVAGIVNVLVSSAVVTLLSGDNWIMETVFPDLMRSSASALVLGAPPGLVFGALFVLPVRRIHRLWRNGAIEAGDQALRLCGGWLLLISLGCLGLDLVTIPTLDSGLAWRPLMLLLVAAVAAIGGGGALLGHWRITRRRSWFQRVQAGKVPGWTILPRARVAEGLDDLRPLFVSSANFNVVLVQHESIEGGGAYRTASNLIPRALIHLPEGLADLSFSLPSDEDRAAREP